MVKYGLSATALLLILTCLSSGQVRRPAPAPKSADATPAPKTIDATPAPSAGPGDTAGAMTTESLFAEACPAIVQVVAKVKGDRSPVTGTGFFIADNGLIATCFHVVAHKGLEAVTITSSAGQTVPAQVMAVDPASDIAILLPSSPIQVPKVLRGREEPARIGEKCMSLGNPSGLCNSLSQGIVSGLRGASEVHHAESKYKYVQTDASIGPGNSGGPLLDESGSVLGVCDFYMIKNSRLSFVVEWKAVRDLVPSAATSQPISLAQVAKEAEDSGRVMPEPTSRPATTERQVASALNATEKLGYCTNCGGTGLVKAKNERREEVPIGGYFGTNRIETHVEWVNISCSVCGGGGICVASEKAYKGLANLVLVVSCLDCPDSRRDQIMAKVCQRLAESAFSYTVYAGGMMEQAARVLANPQGNIGEPVVFYGYIAGLSLGKDNTVLACRAWGTEQLVMVYCVKGGTAMKGQWSQIAGRVIGYDIDAPIVEAISVTKVHPNPRLGVHP